MMGPWEIAKQQQERIERLEAELAGYREAERDGRLVVLPCNLDTKYPDVPAYFSISDKNTIEAHRLDCTWAHHFLRGLIRGANFFTRGEAEAALTREGKQLNEGQKAKSRLI